MPRLLLMRHAKSDWDHPSLGDHDRPLNTRGARSAENLGRWLRQKGHFPDQVMCSSSVRTRQTHKGLALPDDIPVEFARDLYLAEADTMLNLLRTAKNNCVLMIGHNPGICELAHRLLDDPPLHERFADYPTGATLVCDFEITDWSRVDWHIGTAIEFVIPREIEE